MNANLFDGSLVRLSAPDPDRDADIESGWTHDPHYLRHTSLEPARPQSAAQVKEKYAALAKDTGGTQFHFSVRTIEDGRLVGFVGIERIAWAHGTANIQLAIGSPDDCGKGYGSDALQLALRYSFDELNLHRVTAFGFEYNPRAIHFFERAGFVAEVRQRQAIAREGRRWELVVLGLLKRDWRSRQVIEARA